MNIRRGNIVQLAKDLEDPLPRNWDELRDPSLGMYGDRGKGRMRGKQWRAMWEVNKRTELWNSYVKTKDNRVCRDNISFKLKTREARHTGE